MLALYLLKTQVLIVVIVVKLYNYIRQEAPWDWFEKYGNNKLIVINSDDEDE